MNYNLSSKNLVITDAIRSMLMKKLSKVEKYFADNTAADVMLSMEGGRSKIEITVPVKNSTLRCEQSGNDLYALMDDAVEALEKQIKRYRGKLQDLHQSGDGLSSSFMAEKEAAAEEPIRIVRTKRFAVKPMDPIEACLQMELIGHSFYMFLNSESNEVNVVYRRNNGAYGLIEPILDDED